MKTLKKILCTLLLIVQIATPLYAEEKEHPKKSWFIWKNGLDRPWSATLGTGAGLSNADNTQETSYFQKHNTPFGNTWRAEVRMHFIGMEYLLNYNSLNNDKLLTQYIAPTLTFPMIYDNNCQAWYIQCSLGMLNYQQELMTKVPQVQNHFMEIPKKMNFSKNYVAFGVGIGYELALHNRWALDAKLELISGDLFFNENYDLAEGLFGDDEEYDENDGETMFKNNLFFVHFTIALQLGW